MVSGFFVCGYLYAETNSDILSKIDRNEKYLSLEMKRVCTKQGQVKFTLTNVSGETLSVSNFYLNDDKFDAGRAYMILRDLSSDKKIPLGKMNNVNREGYFTVMPDEVVEYLPIDFRKLTKNLNLKHKYKAGTTFLIPIITASGEELDVYLKSLLLSKNGKGIKFGPKCFK